MNNEPCPFCGGSNLIKQISTKDREGTPTNIMCDDCGCAGPWIYLLDKELEEELPKRALELWNKRFS